MSTKQIEKLEASVNIPENVKVNLKKTMLQVEGPLGKTYKNFKKIPVKLDTKEGKVLLKAIGQRKKDYAILNTAKSIVRNLCEGVSKGYTVKILKSNINIYKFPIEIYWGKL